MLLISYNLAIKKHKKDFYEKADVLRLNSPWYTKEELDEILRKVHKPKFIDINIKKRTKAKKVEHDFKELLTFVGQHNIEWVAISNVETTDIYGEVRKLLNNDITNICAKIESKKGCDNINSIIETFDGIMVDNEDLATDIGWENAVKEKDKIYGLCKSKNIPHFRLGGVIFEYINPKKVVYTYGVWDLLHPGHINMIKQAKMQGETLIVGVVGDNAVKEKKGNDRPIQTQDDRLEIVSNLKDVDIAVIQDTYDPVPNLEKYQPDILVKGNDWDYIPGQEWIEKHGGKLIKPAYSKAWSTSKTVEKMK